MKTKLLLTLIGFMYTGFIFGQNYKVDVEGDGDEFIRIHSTSLAFGQAGVELVLGDAGGAFAGDWRVLNNSGTLTFVSSNDNFSTFGNVRMRLTPSGNLGIGSVQPQARLHIDEGQEASMTEDGFLIIGDKSEHNMVFDENEINARNNGVGSSLYIQRHGGNTHLNFGGGNTYTGWNGGNTYLAYGGGNTYTGWNNGHTYLSYGGGDTYTGSNGGNTYLAYGGGDASVGGGTTNAKFNITADGYQMYLRNANDGINDWYIGASSAAWSIGDNRLVFSPTNSSTDAMLQLHDVADNNGTIAPVAIVSGSQKMLLDGNEIDATSSLYINHNSNSNTYINPSGGKVAVANSSPWGWLHVERPTGSTSPPLALESQTATWGIGPGIAGDGSLLFIREGHPALLASVDPTTGAWNIGSDRKLKENIEPLTKVLTKLDNIDLYTYNMKIDDEKNRHMGVIAQEVQAYFPEVVKDNDGTLSVAYSELTVVALKAVKELRQENLEIKETLKMQSSQLAMLQRKVEQLLEDQ